MSTLRYLCCIIMSASVLTLVGCGSGGGGGSQPAGPTFITTKHPNGAVHEEGTVDANNQRTGVWTIYFYNGSKQWQGSYANGVIDNSQSWREWNLDTSIRDDWLDH